MKIERKSVQVQYGNFAKALENGRRWIDRAKKELGSKMIADLRQKRDEIARIAQVIIECSNNDIYLALIEAQKGEQGTLKYLNNILEGINKALPELDAAIAAAGPGETTPNELTPSLIGDVTDSSGDANDDAGKAANGRHTVALSDGETCGHKHRTLEAAEKCRVQVTNGNPTAGTIKPVVEDTSSAKIRHTVVLLDGETCGHKHRTLEAAEKCRVLITNGKPDAGTIKPV